MTRDESNKLLAEWLGYKVVPMFKVGYGLADSSGRICNPILGAYGSEEEAWKVVPDFYADERANALLCGVLIRKLGWYGFAEKVSAFQPEALFCWWSDANIRAAICEAALRWLEGI